LFNFSKKRFALSEKILKPLLYIAIIAIVIVLHFSIPSVGNDPDRYYHFSLSRYMVQEGGFFPKVFPAVENLDWGDYFPDKEFLFHQITAMGYRIAGDSGVIYSSLGISILIALVFFWYASSILPIFVAFSAVGFLYLAPSIFFRLMLVRPHVLAVLLFLGILISLAKRNRIGVFFISVLFALSYHATYVPGICFLIGIGIFFVLPNKENEWLKGLCSLGLLGLFIGTLINPYFPSNVIGSWQIAQIPYLMQGVLQGVSFGSELYQIQANVFLQTMLPSVLVALAAIFYLGNKGTRNLSSSSETILFLMCTLFTLLLAFLSRRGSEYFIPCSGILLCHLLSKFSFDHWKPKAFWGSFCVLFMGLSIEQFLIESKAELFPHVKGTLKAAESLPLENVKVFNCEWDRAPYIIYQRPNAKVVDILDPSLLYFANENMFYQKKQFVEGMVGDPRGMLTNDFKAEYVICSNPIVVMQLQKDPSFQQISPVAKKDSPMDYAEPFVFRIQKREDLPFVKAASGKFFKRHPILEFRNLNNQSKEEFSEILSFENSSYINLEKIYKNKRISSKVDGEFASCALISPTKEEIKRFSGSRYLGIGGGRNIRLWINGREFYQNKTAFVNSSLIKVLVPLEKPLDKNDLVEVMSCSSSKAPFWGIAISFWNQETLSNICKWKKELIGTNALFGEWLYQGESQETCLGPIAAKVISEDLQPSILLP
jgi:hypothetical protein